MGRRGFEGIGNRVWMTAVGWMAAVLNGSVAVDAWAAATNSGLGIKLAPPNAVILALDARTQLTDFIGGGWRICTDAKAAL